MHIKITELPSTLQSALMNIGYHRKDIEIKTSTTYTPANCGGRGYRSFVIAVDLTTGGKSTIYGAWGGSTYLDPKQADLDDSRYPIPVSGAVIHGREGGSRPVYATITVHPEALPKRIEQKVTIPLDTAFALMCTLILTSAGRRNEFARRGRKYSVDHPALQDCIARGWLKANKRGSISATTEGKNMRDAAQSVLRENNIRI